MTTKMSYNKELIYKFIKYIESSNNINILDIYNNSNSNIRVLDNYIRNTLKVVNTKCYEIVLLRKRRAELNQDIQDVYTSFVSGDGYSPNEQGKNTGLKNDSTMLKHIKIKELKDELEKLTNQTFLIEASLEEHKQLVRDVLDQLLSEESAKIMKLFYLECISNRDIANELLYSIVGIKKIKSRSIEKLGDALIEFLKIQLKK